MKCPSFNFKHITSACCAKKEQGKLKNGQRETRSDVVGIPSEKCRRYRDVVDFPQDYILVVSKHTHTHNESDHLANSIKSYVWTKIFGDKS